METQDYTRNKLRTFADGERRLIEEAIANARQRIKGENGLSKNLSQSSRLTNERREL